MEDELISGMDLHGRQYCVYGDTAYYFRASLIGLFVGENVSHKQRCFNTSMARVGSAVV